MSETDHRHEEPALERAVIYRGPQAPVLQAYVPLPVFGAECMLLLLCMRLFGFWTLLLVPLHMVLVLKTNDAGSKTSPLSDDEAANLKKQGESILAKGKGGK